MANVAASAATDPGSAATGFGLAVASSTAAPTAAMNARMRTLRFVLICERRLGDVTKLALSWRPEV